MRSIIAWFRTRIYPLWKHRMVIPLIYLLVSFTQWNDITDCILKVILVNFLVFMAGMVKPALFANFDTIIVLLFFLWVAKTDCDPSKRNCSISPGKVFLTASLWVFNLLVSFITFYIVILGCFIVAYIMKKIVRSPVHDQPNDIYKNEYGMSADEISGLKIGAYQEIGATQGFNEQTKESEACSICLSEFTDSDLVMELAQCRHIFHQHCAEKWLTVKAICPYCRNSLRVELS